MIRLEFLHLSFSLGLLGLPQDLVLGELLLDHKI